MQNPKTFRAWKFPKGLAQKINFTSLRIIYKFIYSVFEFLLSERIAAIATERRLTPALKELIVSFGVWIQNIILL